jgi:hypothetical protein
MIVVADNFLAGALISLLIPASCLVAVVVWYTRTVLRREREREAEATTVAGSAGAASAGATSGGAGAAPADPASRHGV